MAQWRRGAGEDGIKVLTAFRTPKGRYAVHRKRLPGASYWSDPLISRLAGALGPAAGPGSSSDGNRLEAIQRR